MARSALPDRRPDQNPDHATALAITTQLAEAYGGRRLSPLDLRAHAGYAAGWELELPLAEGTERIRLLAKADFPYSKPAVALVTPPAPLSQPHLEQNGKICVFRESDGHDPRDVAGLVKKALRRARALLDAWASGTVTDDFRDEFLSYWNHVQEPTAMPVYGLFQPSPPSRRVRAVRLSRVWVIGETDNAITQWLKSARAEKPRQPPVDALLLWLPEAPLPQEYPLDPDALRRLADQAGAGGELEALLATPQSMALVAFGAETANGPVMAAVGLPVVTKPALPGARKKAKGKKEREWARTLPAMPVIRMDPAWVHGRGVDDTATALGEKRVAILGCGSLGAPVADLLARAGVGMLRLADHQRLESANIGRHRLGAGGIWYSKAKELAGELQRALPHASINGHDQRWQEMDAAHPLFAGHDLVVSLIGEWSEEALLNQYHVTAGKPVPVIYGWAEPFAAAGQAVLVDRHSGCLRCGLDPGGNPLRPVTTWDRETTRQEAGCGAVFQPYGPVELQPIAAMIAELALDVLCGAAGPDGGNRQWAGRRARLDVNGGAWSEDWLKQDGARADGGVLLDTAWPAAPDCPVCAGRDHG